MSGYDIEAIAEAIARRHAISPDTVRGWLAFAVMPEIAERIASLADYGVQPDQLNAMVYAMIRGRPMGTLGPATTTEVGP